MLTNKDEYNVLILGLDNAGKPCADEKSLITLGFTIR